MLESFYSENFDNPALNKIDENVDREAEKSAQFDEINSGSDEWYGSSSGSFQNP